MKTIIILLLTLLSLWSARAQGFIHLTAGESYTYQFSTVPFQYFGELSEDRGHATFYFASAMPDPQNSLRLEMFETSTLELPIHTTTVNGFGTSVFMGRARVWQDLQGAMRVTVLSGTADVSAFGVAVIGGPLGPFNYHSLITTVPEPSAVALFGVGTLAVFFIGRRRNR